MSNWLETQFSLAGKTALITGASKGIGASIAIAFAQAGADIVLSGRSPESLSNTRHKIQELGGKVEEIVCDLSNIHEIPTSFNSISVSNVDILINNAGTISREPAISAKADEWRKVIDSNLNSVFLISQACAKGMLQRKNGRIINIASLLSFQGGINVPAYAASKHGVAGLTKALANEWGASGVTVNAIAPGYIETDNTEALRNDQSRNQAILNRIPMGRWGVPEDISGVAVFLAAPAARYINGEILTVDGGWMSR